MEDKEEVEKFIKENKFKISEDVDDIWKPTKNLLNTTREKFIPRTINKKEDEE